MSKEVITGLTVRQGASQWTVLRKTRDTFTVVASRKAPLDMEANVAIDLLAAAESDVETLSAEIRTKCSGFEGRVAVGLPPGCVLMRVAELPTIDADELKNMVRFQADRLSPFPAENTITAYDVLDRTDTSSRVVIAVVQRKTVDLVGTVLRGARISPHRLDVETLCWWRLLVDSGEIMETGCQLTILKDASACEVIATRNGVPVIFRSLGSTEDLSDEELCSELDYTLTTLEAEHGISDVAALCLWHWGVEPIELMRMLREKLPFEVRCGSFESLPALSEGLARRALDAGTAGLNLAPTEWRAREKEIQVRKNLVIASVILLGIWLGSAGVLFGGARFYKSRSNRSKHELDELKKATKEAGKMRSVLLLAEQYTNRTYSALECLKMVTDPKVRSKAIELSVFRYDNHKNKRITVQGESTSEGAVYDYENVLANAKFFTTVKLKGPTRTRVGRYRFMITLGLPKGNQ